MMVASGEKKKNEKKTPTYQPLVHVVYATLPIVVVVGVVETVVDLRVRLGHLMRFHCSYDERWSSIH